MRDYCLPAWKVGKTTSVNVFAVKQLYLYGEATRNTL